MSTDITADEFMAGLIAACRIKGFETISLREDRFHHAVKAAFDELVAQSPGNDLDVRFAVFLDPLHHDSPVVGQAVNTAVQRKLVSLDNPEFVNMRIKLDTDAAEELLEGLPGGAEFHRSLADVFIRAELSEDLAPTA